MSCAAIAASATAIVIAGQGYDVGRPVVLWCDAERGFDGYSETCVERSLSAGSHCCRRPFRRYGERRGVRPGNLQDLQRVVRQLVLHHDGCVNSRSCFYSMHDQPTADGGCGLSAHFMIDADGTIYQTLDVSERAFHAEGVNPISIGVEMCNRADASRNELDRLPPDYRTRPVRAVEINGRTHRAFEYRPEQYASAIALTRVLLRAFPNIEPAVPQKERRLLSTTLADPLAWRGIAGHFHVDSERRKWDPGAFDWNRLLESINGVFLPVQIRGFSWFPATDTRRLALATRAALFNAEERAGRAYPVGPGGLWDTGVYLPAQAGTAVRAPARGVVRAVRAGKPGASESLILIAHQLSLPSGGLAGDEPGEKLDFFTLLTGLQPFSVQDPAAVVWLHNLVRRGDRRALATLGFGDVTLVDERVEPGDLLGFVGHDQTSGHFGVRAEVLSGDPPPRAFAPVFHVLDASADGATCRRGAVLEALEAGSMSALDRSHLRAFVSSGPLDRRQALRGFAIRLRHPSGDRNTLASFLADPGLGGLSPAERRALYEAKIAPQRFWNDAVARHAGLPRDQVVYAYHPVTFFSTLAAAFSGTRQRWPARSLVDRSLPAGAERGRGALQWILPPEKDRTPAVLGPLVRPDYPILRREDQELVILPPLDN
jgi:N-acetylmuramoyl-L-alanine amidase